MRLDGGGFKSAIDAETDGEEGAYYVWTGTELRDALGADGYDLLGPLFGFDGPPNFEGKKYTLYLADTLDAHAKRLGWSRSELLEKLHLRWIGYAFRGNSEISRSWTTRS